VPGQPFFFRLEFSSDGLSQALLEEVASQVLRHAGCSAREMPELDAALARAAATAAAERRCDLRFSFEDGALEIVVSSDGGRIFQTSHLISSRS
jgi:hypothetical protein